MASNSTEEKLAKVFQESFQIKRLNKEISDLKDLREKGQYDIRMSVIKNQCLVFRIDMLPSAYKGTKVPQECQILQQIKIVIRKDYPAHPPKAFFMGKNMSRVGIKPFRDYFPVILGELPWSAKFTICQITKSLPNFIQKFIMNKSIIHPFPSFQQYFELDNLLSWDFVQVHPIRLIKKSTSKQAFIVINVFQSELMILDENGLESSYMTCDYVQGNQIVSLRKKKNTTNRLLLQVKLSYSKMKGKYGIEFYSQDYDGLLIGIMDCTKNTTDNRAASEKSSQKNTQDKSESSSESDESDGESASYKKQLNEEASYNINEVQESIVVYESLADNNMTSQNISQLVQLLKKAIEHYSASGDQRFRIYLQKLQKILSNQMAQVLLESQNAEGNKKKEASFLNHDAKEEEYTSLIDLI